MRKSRYRTMVAVAISIFIIIALCGCDSTQKPPAKEEGEFPFRFVYELDGVLYSIEDTVVCKFSGYDHSAWFTKPRRWDESLKSGATRISILSDQDVYSVFNPQRINSEMEVFLDYGMGAYYMGDPNAHSFIHGHPHVCYRERYSESEKVTTIDVTVLSEKQLEEFFGITVIEFTFSDPIKNTF